MGREGEGRGSQRQARPPVLSAAAAHRRAVHEQAQEPAPSARGPCPATPRALAVVEEGLTGGQAEAAAKAHSRHAPVLIDAHTSTSTATPLQRLSKMQGRPDAKHSSAEQAVGTGVGAGGEVVRGTGAGTVSPAATAATARHKVGAAVRERRRKRHGGTTQSQTQSEDAHDCRPRRTRHSGETHLDTPSSYTSCVAILASARGRGRGRGHTRHRARAADAALAPQCPLSGLPSAACPSPKPKYRGNTRRGGLEDDRTRLLGQ